MNDNHITILPPEIGNLTNLCILSLSNNKLKRIPREIKNLHNLRYLFLANNKLKYITSKISRLTYLEKLVLENNKLKKLPVEILDIKNALEINETSYDIENLDIDTEIIILKNLNSNLLNLPMSLYKIYCSENIKDKIEKNDIKLPFGCEIEYF